MAVGDTMLFHKFIFVALVVVMVGMVMSIDAKWPVNILNVSQHGYVGNKNIVAYNTLSQVTNETTAYESLIFVGDVLLARNIEVLMNRYGHSYPYEAINFNEYATTPAVIGNFESSIPVEHVFTRANTVRFSVNKIYLSELKEAGFTHLSLANNHTLDFGASNFIHTSENLIAKDFAVFGHPTQLSSESFSILEVQGYKFAVIGLHVLYTFPTEQEIEELFRLAKDVSDYQIVFIHWGEEYELQHNHKQRRFAETLVQAGADLIIGHHPHVVQGIEIIDGTPVFYSLGNFIFDQYFSNEVQTGLMLLVNFDPEPTIYLQPVESKTTWSQPRVHTPEQYQQFLSDIGKRSDSEIQAHLKQGSIPWQKIVATSSKIAMIK